MSNQRQLQIGGALVIAMAVTLLVVTAAWAQGAAASQPATTAPSLWGWIVANPTKSIAALVVLLATLATGLSNYPKAEGVVKVLRLIVACLSAVPFSNSPGSLRTTLRPEAPTLRLSPRKR